MFIQNVYTYKKVMLRMTLTQTKFLCCALQVTHKLILLIKMEKQNN